MCDAVYYYRDIMKNMSQCYFMDKLTPLYQCQKSINNWYLATVHRAENTQNINSLQEILSAFEELDAPVILPVHPRIKNYVNELNHKYTYKNIIFSQPFSYLEMLYFVQNSIKIITDLGGLQICLGRM